jgi:hypothetical protein
VHERFPSKIDNSLSGSTIRPLGSVYRELLSNELFRFVDQETCFNKPLSSDRLFRHNMQTFIFTIAYSVEQAITIYTFSTILFFNYVLHLARFFIAKATGLVLLVDITKQNSSIISSRLLVTTCRLSLSHQK